jgi:hypothetical protein
LLLARFLTPESNGSPIAAARAAPESFEVAWQRLANSDEVGRIGAALVGFTRSKLPLKASNPAVFAEHVRALTACLLGDRCTTSPEHYDHCYADLLPPLSNGIAFPAIPPDRVRCGVMSSGFARRAAAAAVRIGDGPGLFLDNAWLSAIRTNRNASSRGFQVEQAALSAISSSGLVVRGESLRPQQTVLFESGQEREARRSGSDGCVVLYLPTAWNYDDIDGVIRCVTPAASGGRTVHVIALQSTVASPDAHRASVAKFLQTGAGRWGDEADTTVSWTFVWLTRSEHVRPAQVHLADAKTGLPAFVEEYYGFAEINRSLGFALEGPSLPHPSLSVLSNAACVTAIPQRRWKQRDPSTRRFC